MRDQALTKIDLSLRRKAWERNTKKKQTTSTTAGRFVGVAAIVARNKRRNEEAKALSKSAFGDFEGLLQRAREVQAVIEKYSTTLDKKQQNNRGITDNYKHSNNTNTNSEDEIKLTNMLRGMGMANAVTKNSTGSTSMYHEQLARQLADFLGRSGGALQSSGGMMTLVDVYCLYNRARGTNLISPDDLLSVVGLLQTLRLGMSMVSAVQCSATVIKPTLRLSLSGIRHFSSVSFLTI